MKQKFFIRKTVICALVLTLILSAFTSASATDILGEEKLPSESEYGYTYRFVTRDTIEITSYFGYETEVYVPSSIDGFKVVGIACFNSTPDGPSPNEKVKKVTLPDSVTYIGDEAFARGYYSDTYSYLQEIVLPDSLLTIGEYAFSNCIELKSIEIPQSVTQIGAYAFESCQSLNDIRFLGSNTKLCDSAFGNVSGSFAGAISQEYNSWLYDDSQGDFFVWNNYALAYKGNSKSPVIPDGVKGITGEIFKYSSEITSVTIPDSVEYIGNSAFYGTALTSVEIPSGVERIESSAFSHCESLSDIKFNEGLKYIGYDAFHDCSALTNIVLPDGLLEMDSCVFSSCYNIKNITFPDSLCKMDLSSIQDTEWYYSLADGTEIYCGSVFLGIAGAYTDYPSTLNVRPGTLNVVLEYDCYGLKTLNLPDGLKSITLKAGSYCNITTLNIPQSVEYINCYEMYSLTTLNLPKEAKLEKHAFENSPKLKSVTIPEGNPYLCAFNQCDALESITLPDDVLELSDGIGGKSLKSIDLGNLRVLGDNALKDCTRLESISLPDTLVAIGYDALSGCGSLKSVKGGSNVKILGDTCFKDCIALTDFGELTHSVRNVEHNTFENTGWYNNQPDGVVYFGNIAYCYKGNMPAGTVLALKDGTTAVTDCFIFDQLPVTPKVAAEFSQPNLVGVILPESCERVNTYAFSNSPNVKTIVLGGTQIVEEMAFNDHACETIVLPDTMKYVGADSFASRKLKNISLNNGLRAIERGAFFTLGTGKSITIPESVTYLGIRCIGYCPNEDEWDVITVPDFVIHGVSNSAAQVYADENGITFSTDTVCDSHNFDSETVPPTCQSEGYTRKVCTVCGKVELSEKTAKTGHIETADSAVEATCVCPGLSGGSHCCACGYIISLPKQTPALGHDWVVTEITDPSQPDYGMILHRCSRCELAWYEPSGQTHSHKYGDVNCDGSITMVDVTSLQKIIANLCTHEQFGEESKINSDVNHDDRISMVDVTYIQKYIANLIKDFN